ncbi:MAG TPA: endonuclease MutS2 [Gemmatimonadaceae bacterium]|nr:endonuclease MutS2 [Gemmatimonadaceae bacterium]
MNAHALGVLELPRVLDLVAQRATSDLGAARIRRASTSPDRSWIEREQTRIVAVRALITSDDPWSPEPIPDLTSALARLRIEGTSWSGAELLSGAVLLASSRRTRDALREARVILADFAERMVVAPDQEKSISRAIDEDGTVRDGASPLLARLRRDLKGAQNELIRLLERIMSRLDPGQQVADGSVTMRNGRYVIPVRRGGQVSVGGIVHDTSSTGATLFVEPPAAVEAGNRIREMEAEEAREVERVLRELTDALRPLHAALVDALDALVELDTLAARARYAIDFNCATPDLAEPESGMTIRDGRHPLLLAQGIPVVPFDLEMAPNERTLLLSGPNTGGKTVLLKSVGLFSAMVSTGLPAPVGPESRVPLYDEIFADIGDEQSIAASLSTFSAHVKNLGDILAHATARSLVLIDELGSGTDPIEGAALGGAVLEDLTGRGTMTLATTHLGALKDLASEVSGVVNASLQFDVAKLEPTYRLQKGVPGRSYGLSIARRLHLPDAVLARAEERVPRAERDVDALLADLERRDAMLAEQEAHAAELIAGAESRFSRLESREHTVRERERDISRRAHEDARQYILRARREIDRVVSELRAGATPDAIRSARRQIESLATAHADATADTTAHAEATAHAELPPDVSPATRPGVGSWVELGTLGGRLGRVLELRHADAVVAVGSLKMTVPVDTLKPSRQTAPVESVPTLADIPEAMAAPEIDLRGMRADEAEERVMYALDAAIRADLPSLRVIHGKGTGALRERVAEMLRKDSRVKHFRLGAWNEGGAGVTIAELT